MALNFAPQKKTYIKPSPAHKSLDKKKIFKSFFIPALLVFMFFCYPAWSLAKKYKLIKEINNNLDQIAVISQLDSEEDINLDALQSNIKDLMDSSKGLDNIKDSTYTESQKNLIDQYNYLVLEYSNLLIENESTKDIQIYLNNQNEIWESINISDSILEDIDISSYDAINKEISAKEEFLVKVKQKKSSIEKNNKEFFEIYGDDLENKLKPQLKNFDKLIEENLDTITSDTESLLSILDILKNLLIEDLNADTATIEKIVETLDEKTKNLTNASSEILDLSTSDHMNLLKETISDYLLSISESCDFLSESIQNEKNISLESVTNLSSDQDDINLANQEISNYYIRLETTYKQSYDAIANIIIEGELQADIETKRIQLIEMEEKLKLMSVEIDNANLTDILKP